MAVAPGPVAALNRAVAVPGADGPGAAIASPCAARGASPGPSGAYDRAIARVDNPTAKRAFLRRRRAEPTAFWPADAQLVYT
jgi:predicted RNA polymerase sigma factor